jgi:hypothetical protein
MAQETELCKLALKYGTDKGPGGHNYTPYYHSLFKDRRESVKKVLELGIDQGWSLFMWRDYFPNAIIYGLESNPNWIERLRHEERMTFFQCDQSYTVDLVNAGGWAGPDFDFMVDDGSHQPQHQIQTANILASLLGIDGVYVIEDVGHPEAVIPQLRFRYEIVQPETARPDVEDDRLIVIRGEHVW